MQYHQSIPLQKNGQEYHYKAITALTNIKDKYDYDGMACPVDYNSIEQSEEENKRIHIHIQNRR